MLMIIEQREIILTNENLDNWKIRNLQQKFNSIFEGFHQ